MRTSQNFGATTGSTCLRSIFKEKKIANPIQAYKLVQRMLLELELAKNSAPRLVENEFSEVIREASGHYLITNERFRNKLRTSKAVSLS
jgi:hypothetical protein